MASEHATGDWRRAAACLEQDPDLFFPEGTRSLVAREQIAEARAVCSLCEVRGECLRWALDTGLEFGVCGGLTETERRAVLLGLGRSVVAA